MNKGSKTKTKIQQITKELILTKGYPFVTMTDVSLAVPLSIGGLYYHYGSIEEILMDLIHSETGNVWMLFEGKDTFDSLISALEQYFELEKRDLLTFDHTLNTILYQYYFSFPQDKRKAILEISYTQVMEKMQRVLISFFKDEEPVKTITNHLYVVLQGLNMLAMTGRITPEIIDWEFEQTVQMIKDYYMQQKGTGL